MSDIPLLFELGLEGEFDAVVVVEAPETERLRRLVEDRGLDEEEAKRIMSAQTPSREKRTSGHLVLENGGTMEALKRKALEILDLLRARASEEGIR